MPNELNELVKSVAALSAQGNDLVKSVGEMKTRLDSPDFSGLRHTDSQGRVVGEWSEEDTDPVELVFDRSGSSRGMGLAKSYRQQKKEIRSLLKSSGYKKWNTFKSPQDFIRSGFDKNPMQFETRLGDHFKAIQGMSTTAGADGGFTVLPEFAPGIIDRVYNNDLWARTDNYTVTGNNMTFLANAETSRVDGSRHGGLRGYWVDEAGTLTKSKPTTRTISMKLHKLAVLVYLTDELIADTGMALEQYITRKASEEFNFLIGDAVFNGNGAGKPVGIMNAPSLVSVSKEAGQPAATIQAENIVKMYSRFFAPNLGNMQWYNNQDIGPQLDLMTLGIGAAGIAVFMPPNGLKDAPFGTLRGRPLNPIEFAATLGTTGDIVAADLGQVLSISKGGIAQASSLHLEFLTDQMAIRFTMRLNAQPWDNAAITPYKGTATQSNFVSLATR